MAARFLEDYSFYQMPFSIDIDLYDQFYTSQYW